MILKPAIFFDRDNTLIACDGYLGDPGGVVLMPGAARAVARAREMGFVVVVVSNQSGVARGLFTEQNVHAVNRRLDELLREGDANAVIDRHEYCPYHPAASVAEYRVDSELRKPKPGMILRARRELNLAPGGWCVGDAPRDITAGRAAGCRTILFKPQGVPQSPAAGEATKVAPDFEVTTLSEAMDIIERLTRPVTPATTPQGSTPQGATPPPKESAPAPAPVVAPVTEVKLDTAKIERLLEGLLMEVKRSNLPSGDFSITKMLAGVVQICTLALLLLTYLSYDSKAPNPTVLLLLAGVVLQSLVTSLLVMGRQK